MHCTAMTVDATVTTSLESEYDQKRSDGCCSNGDPTVRGEMRNTLTIMNLYFMSLFHGRFKSNNW
jgi:hypothetical protein